MTHYMPALKAARLKNIEGVEKWKNDIIEDLRKKNVILPDLVGLPPEAAAIIDAAPLPSLEERGKNENSLHFMCACTCTCTCTCICIFSLL